jgi:hypothetical protein
MPTPIARERESVTWAAGYVIICEQRGPDRLGEFQRRYRSQAKNQGPDNSVFGSVSSPSNVDIEHAHLVSEQDWETGH